MLSLLERVDHWLFVLINNGLGHDWLDPFFLGLSSLGQWTIALVALAALADGGRRMVLRHLAAIVLVLLALAPLHYGLKEWVNRSRPAKVFAEQVEPQKPGVAGVRPVESDLPRRHSFPSGHTALAFFFMAYVAFNKRAYRFWAYGLATLVALSRVYVGAHFPSDCVAGALIGAAGGWLAWHIHRQFDRRREKTS